MSGGAPAARLARLAELLGGRMGLDFTSRRRSELQRGICSAAPELGFADADECVRSLLSAPINPRQIEILAGHLTTGETYFFRDQALFDVLEKQVLPALIDARRGREQRLRIWSAACCSGEEAYSLAITVRNALPDLAHWQVIVQGSDINPRFLSKAESAVFGEWSFRGTASGFKERYFVPTDDGRWRVRREFREMAQFFLLNLAEDVYPALLNQTNATDLVLCRNVLIYFTPERAARVVHKLAHCLVDGGWLVLGPNELHHAMVPELVPVQFPGAILFRKDASQSRATESPPTHGTLASPSAPSISPVARCSIAATESVGGAPLASTSAEAVILDEESSSVLAYEPGHDHCEQGGNADAARMLGAGGDTATEWALRARTYANQGRLDEALTSCERAIAADKCNPVSHYLHAIILQELGALADARSAYRRALYLDPQFVLAHFGLGNLAVGGGDFGVAGRHFDNAAALACTFAPEALLPEGEGLTAGRLVGIIDTLKDIRKVPR